MPPQIWSRYEFCRGFEHPITGKQTLTERVPYRYQDLSDNVQHTVGLGDSLFNLAGRYFKGLTDRPCGLWWIIGDFQPTPIIDPTIRLDGVIIIPSLRTIQEEIFNQRRRDLF